MKPRLLSALLVLLLLSGCAAKQRPPSPGSSIARGEAMKRLLVERRASSGTNYRIAPGDRLRISVPGADEISGEFTVARDGIVTLPLVGDQRVAGQSETAVADSLRSILSERYLQAPEVLVSTSSRGRKVSVLGAVGRPGPYDLLGTRETILDLLTRAGGITSDASPRILFTPGSDRNAPGDTKRAARMLLAADADSSAAEDRALGALEIDLTDLYQGRGVPELDMPVRDGDSILVKPGGQIFVQGWVEKPQPYDLLRGMTLTQVITKAGGVSFAGAKNGVTLIRQGSDGRLGEYNVDYSAMVDGKEKDIYLLPGDRIHVAASPVKVVPWGVYTFVSSIVRLGISGGVALF